MKRDLRFRNCFKALLVMVFFGIGNLGFAQQTATYTVSTINSATQTGTKPVGAGHSYAQTYNTASQITGGNSATLTLTGYAGYKITSIGMSMKSNTSSGTGGLSVVAGTTTIFSIPGATFVNAAWNGAWSTSYVDIPEKTPTAYNIATGESVVIKISATANSLYVESFSITYVPVATVTFNKNATDATGTMANQTASTSTALTTNGFTRPSYTFAGWNTAANGSGTSYVNGANYPFTASATLYAQWTLATVTWDGSTNNSWSNAANWTPGVVPTGAQNVVISSGTPTLDTNFTLATGKTLTVSGTGSLTINPTRTLTIAGTAAFNDKNIIFKSDANGTASFGAVTGTVTGATNVTVERFVSGRRAFRFLSPGVTTTTSIFDNWQNGGLPTAGIGTHITGAGGTDGFDATGTNNPSLHTYNAQATGTTTGFTAATNTNSATLKAGVGYRLLVRGDRNVDLTVASSDDMNSDTVLSANGTLTTGSVVFNSTAGSPAPINNNAANTQTDGFTLIGNPYVSPVDWDLVTKTGVSNDAYYSWDPTLGTATQRGRYVVYSPTLGTNLYGGSALAQANRKYLQSGQAVFIKNTDLAVPATVIFNESNKAGVYSYVFRSSQQAVTTVGNSALFLTAYEPNELALGGSPIDGAVALFGSNFSNSLNAQDVDKLSSSGENVAFVRENKNLAIETLAPVATDDVLFVKTLQFQADKSYTFKVNTENFDTTVSAKLVDLYLNTETSLDLTQPSFVNFATTSDANSYASDRFKIVFNSAALGTGTFTGSAIAVFPNPIANNQFSIALPSNVSGKVTVSMSNMLGQVVYNETSEANSTMVIAPTQQLQEGVYVVSVSNNGKVMQSKVVVRN